MAPAAEHRSGPEKAAALICPRAALPPLDWVGDLGVGRDGLSRVLRFAGARRAPTWRVDRLRGLPRRVLGRWDPRGDQRQERVASVRAHPVSRRVCRIRGRDVLPCDGALRLTGSGRLGRSGGNPAVRGGGPRPWPVGQGDGKGTAPAGTGAVRMSIEKEPSARPDTILLNPRARSHA